MKRIITPPIMRNRSALIVSAVVLFICGILPATPTRSSPTPLAKVPARSLGDIIKGIYPQLSLKTMTIDQAMTIANERLIKDPLSEGKVALNFYGKVVDENNHPVQGADVHMDWNTVGVLGGTAYAEISSDESGLFSLTGQHGKILGVRVEKSGYYTVEGGMGTVNFEYANPSSPDWYEPDPKHPVIFHLRKKGEGAKLFTKSLNIPVDDTHPQAHVNLMQGFIKPDGGLTITSDTSKFLPGNQAFPWTVTLSMAEGGLLETDEQFPFLAPENGYVSTVTIDMTNLDRAVWRGQTTKTYYFYIPSTKTYGRMTVSPSVGLPVGLDFSYNLTPGSRILEPASQ